MKILILNTSERIGGAAVAANRLMHALNKTGYEARMLVRDKQTDDERIVSLNTTWWHCKINRFRFIWERLVIFFHNCFTKKNLFAVSIANIGTNISKHPLVKEADIIHLHWINQGFLSLKNIRQLTKLNKPIVWTMHDMWSCTGICHHARACERYSQQCEKCFFLHHPAKKDISTTVFRKKQQLYQQADISFVTCSDWLNKRAKKSALLLKKQISTINNPIDTKVFAPFDKIASRKKLGLATDKKLILFSAVNLSDSRKGFSYLAEAAQLLDINNVELLLLGNVKTVLPELPLKINYIAFTPNEADMAMVYSAVDCYVTPSLEENLPNTIMEAMACGTPCVGFDTGGIPEMIDHKITGYVANYQSADDLAAGIRWVLSEADYAALSAKAGEKARSYYSEWIIAGEYMELYKKILYKNHL
ncbi:MAG: glycosyltransferase family 4 protein [Prevotellaceae bacterium]|jgi:glycosyltransferase involved in cell wall biosynthesis|nr:glycosyltransferase family 4 protein [Prevotellaceae bacterium]